MSEKLYQWNSATAAFDLLLVTAHIGNGMKRAEEKVNQPLVWDEFTQGKYYAVTETGPLFMVVHA